MACPASLFLSWSDRPLVSPRNTGTVPAGSMMTNSVTNTSRKNFIRDTSKLSLFPARPKNCRREMHVCFPSCHNWGRAVVLHPVGPGDPAWTRQAGPQLADLCGDHRGLLRGVAGPTPKPALPDVRGFGSATSSDVHLGRPHLRFVRRAVPAPPVGRAGVLPAKQDVRREREGRGRKAAGQAPLGPLEPGLDGAEVRAPQLVVERVAVRVQLQLPGGELRCRHLDRRGAAREVQHVRVLDVGVRAVD